MKRKKRNPKSRRISVWFGVFAFLLVAFLSFYLLREDENVTPKRSAEKTVGYEAKVTAKKIKPLSSKKHRRVAFIIDDVGYDPSIVDEILALKVPVALSVLPFCPYSAESARKAHEGGMEVLLHLPMEPLDYPEKNPGKGALLIDMTDEEIKNQLEEDIKAVPYASGANNHMGSGFTEYEKKMEVVLRRLKDRGFFFVDSCTTNNSKSRKAAQSVGIRYASRDVFIDNSINFDDTFAILKNLSDKNKKWKSLVIIGHSHESTIRAMGEALPVLRSGNISIVPLSDLINNG